MKRMLTIMIIMINIIFFETTYAYTSGFEYMLENMNIKKLNINGLKISEEIFNKYNLLVYGNPLLMKKNQRWKNKDTGNWAKDGNAWNGEGIRGEYWILGENAEGREVHNEIFPDDYNSGTSPLNWNYVEIDDAEESWSDAVKYQTDRQKEYMLTQKLSRNGIEYDLTAQNIGTSKARVENFATWKTVGSIYTKKIGRDGVYWSATFNIQPMAADAQLESKLNFKDGLEYNIDTRNKRIAISVSYGAVLKNLSNYAQREDLKNIQAELIIDGNQVDSISDENELDIEKNYILQVDKEKYVGQDTIEISVKCNSMAETCFTTDIPLYSSIEEILIIHIQNENQIEKVGNTEIGNALEGKPRIADVEVKRVSTDERGNEVYKDLYYSKKTRSEYVCAGQVIYIKVRTFNDVSNVTLEIEGEKSVSTLDKLTEKFEWAEPKERKVKTRFKSLSVLKKLYKMPVSLELVDDNGNGEKYFSITYIIPYKAKQTLHSWATLREENKNAFEIDEKRLFERIGVPYKLVLKARSKNGVTTERYSIDVFEAWNTIYNREV